MRKHFNFAVMVHDVTIPVSCDFNDGGEPINLKSAEHDENMLFDNFKNVRFKIRRKDYQGNDREHDARVCASRYLDNGNIDLRLEVSDVYISLYDIARAVSVIAHKNGDGIPVSHENGDVIAFAISNYV